MRDVCNPISPLLGAEQATNAVRARWNSRPISGAIGVPDNRFDESLNEELACDETPYGDRNPEEFAISPR